MVKWLISVGNSPWLFPLSEGVRMMRLMDEHDVAIETYGLPSMPHRQTFIDLLWAMGPPKVRSR